MKQYIEFILGIENYVIEMSYVREIIKPVHITELVGVPEFVKGVSKIRDEVITIIDLHQKFNIDSATCEAYEPRIIILEFNSENIGLLVNDVVDILESDNITNVPSLIHHGIIREILNLEDKILPIFDIERLFSSDVTQWLNSEEIS
ncbi:chemotaxis protein CheW [Desulfitobacterium sp.]|uniref:chemotaxis protein CheW n=1 Tax=Desulfitobacterium sp. TaxID=49981 RepID=UPI002C712640|nr:chemotaxis protein CheW [Desulfitobacterium sp.]HVJ50810.1 chemotaxis protein CheW [Desulfitobacterium sp.]